MCIVDEFQDTDSLQWEILHTLFHSSPDHRLLLVGDPKQSIYRFRGADLHTYMRAKKSVGSHSRLETNWRSSPRMVEAINLLFGKREDLPYYPIHPSPNPPDELQDGLGSLHIHQAPTTGERSAESALIKQIVEESKELIENRLVRPEEIAILVRDRHQMKRVVTAFRERGLSISAQRAHNAFETDSFTLLTDAALAATTKERRETLQLSLHPLLKSCSPPCPVRLEEAFSRGGPAEFLRSLILQTKETEDLVALEELFAQDPSYNKPLEVWARFLLEEGPWQEHLVWPKNDEPGARVMTIHASKGLEFSVVFALGLASRQRELPWLVKHSEGLAPRAHDPAAYERALEELEAEKIRLAYVALTRAKLRAVLPYIPPKSTPHCGLASPAELLFAHWEIEDLLAAGGAALSSVHL